MEMDVKVNPSVLLRGDNWRQLREDLEKSMNTMMGQFVADLVATKGAGQYEIRASRRDSMTSDSMVWHFDARLVDGSRPGFPYPFWEEIPEWATFWTVSALGAIKLHELKPILVQQAGAWYSKGRSVILKEQVVIPIGIDWRTLCFERPVSMVTRIKDEAQAAHDKAYPPENESSWGAFGWLQKFIP